MEETGTPLRIQVASAGITGVKFLLVDYFDPKRFPVAQLPFDPGPDYMPYYGLLAPIFVWVMRGKRSMFLKFHSVQTIVYQVGTTLLYFVAGFLYVFGLIVFIITIGFEGAVAFDSSGGLIGAIVFLVSLLIAMLIVLIVPLLHILGQWAGYRVVERG